MSLSYAWWKKYVFYYFKALLIVFHHANACTSMRLLVDYTQHITASRRKKSTCSLISKNFVSRSVSLFLNFSGIRRSKFAVKIWNWEKTSWKSRQESEVGPRFFERRKNSRSSRILSAMHWHHTFHGRGDHQSLQRKKHR